MMKSIAIRPMGAGDAAALAHLLAGYSREMRHAAPSPPDPALAAGILADPKAELLGAFQGETPLGFVLFFDLPEAISGRRAGQIDDLYVSPDARGHRLAQRLIGAVADLGRQRGWVHLRWLVPQDNLAAQRAYDRLAERAPWLSFALWLDRQERW